MTNFLNIKIIISIAFSVILDNFQNIIQLGVHIKNKISNDTYLDTV